jgi:hypothetical protein
LTTDADARPVETLDATVFADGSLEPEAGGAMVDRVVADRSVGEGDLGDGGAIDDGDEAEAPGLDALADVTPPPPVLTPCGDAGVDLQSDPENCNRCGRSCAGGGCYAGECEAFQLAITTHPIGIAVDSNAVYFTDCAGNGAGSVKKVPLDGGAVTVLASGQECPSGIAVDSSSVYWADVGTDAGGGVRKVGLDGGTVQSLAEGRPGPAFVAVDASSVYWVEREGAWKLGLDGGAPVPVAKSPGKPAGIALNATDLFWVTNDETNDAGYCVSAAVVKAPIGGGTATTLFSDECLAPGVGISVGPTSVYWAQTSMLKIPVDGYMASSTGWDPFGAYRAVGPTATDENGVYVAQQDSIGFFDFDLVGGVFAGLPASQSMAPQALAVDATRVYWTTLTTGLVMSMTKELQ